MSPVPQLTADELERMREIVLAHDKQTQVGMKEFDLNNPPKEHYRFQKFPQMLYDHETGGTRVVHTEAALARAVADGWSPEAKPAEVDEPTGLGPDTLAEVAALDAEARKPKKKKGE